MWICVIYVKPRACFWKNFWKAKLHRANLQWCFLSPFSHTVKEHTPFARWVATFLLLHYWKKTPWTLFTWLTLGMEKIKIVFTSETDALQMTGTSGGRLLHLFWGLLCDLTEIDQVGSTLPNLLILNLLELLRSCLGAAVRAWNCTSCYPGKSKKCQVPSGQHHVSWTLATDGQRLLAEFILSDPGSSLTMPCSAVSDAE